MELHIGNATKRCNTKCQACPYIYSNFWKPKNCPKCNFEIGGSYVPKPKKAKLNHPDCVSVGQNLFSVKTSTRGDRCFVISDEHNKLCHQEKCKTKRAITVASLDTMVSQFTCKHLKLVETNVQAGEEWMMTSKMISDYPCDNSTKDILNATLPVLAEMPAVVQTGDGSFVVYGPPSSASPLGYVHVHKNADRYRCTSKNCKIISGAGRQQKISKLCVHQHVLFCALNLRNMPSTSSLCAATSPETSTTTTTSSDSSAPINISTSSGPSVGHLSSIQASLNRSIPYVIPPEILKSARQMDAATILNAKEGAWPLVFEPDETICRLCKCKLGQPHSHPGSNGNSYMLTNSNPFLAVKVNVKVCSNKKCKALHQVWPFNLGLFNICDKVLVAFDIFLEWREYFKRGVPISSAIESKLQAWSKQLNKDQRLSSGELKYLQGLVYNGFYCFELITERCLDDVICGVCGIIGQFYLGDGNQKNCCSLNGVNKKKSSKSSPVPLEEFLCSLKSKWIEKMIFSNVDGTGPIDAADVPPIIPPALRGDQIYNTEMEKQSIYLNQKTTTTKDSAMLHHNILEENLNMDDLDSMDLASLKSLAEQCKIELPSNSTKSFIVAELHSLYGELLHGNSPCHGFGRVNGHTGGFYHIVCRHGCTVASKFLLLQESVRDAADLYLSLKYPPSLFVCDTPCGLARHMDLRCPDVAHSFWGDNSGCFEKPQLNRQPSIRVH